MKITELNLENAFIIKPSSRSDFRGDFKRLYSSQNLKINKLKFNLKQINLSNNFAKGTIRGLHYFDIRKKEFKIVNCP